jgi:SAM-dependent methyltransferase
LEKKSMNTLEKDNVRLNVRNSYSQVALLNTLGSCCEPVGCCSTSGVKADAEMSLEIGYSLDDLNLVPEGANMGLGCGNPKAIASLKPGEIVVDLGSGGGFDCFLASREVGETGKVIGVDMTPEMISKARANAVKGEFTNVEFRLGEIENLPVADNFADVIISNCVINLSPDKQRVFEDSFRILKSGGRLAISDVVATADIPKDVREDLSLYSSCVSGASRIEEIENILQNCGFKNIKIEPKDESKEFMKSWAPGKPITDFVISSTIEAVKP